jgi:hypothetical protein
MGFWKELWNVPWLFEIKAKFRSFVPFVIFTNEFITMVTLIVIFKNDNRVCFAIIKPNILTEK